ncbi:MAG: hypothetical protein HY658_03920 [Actinobacteria bacterium]|nr:hypothetical protein [Actinomycetota bacterium]
MGRHRATPRSVYARRRLLALVAVLAVAAVAGWYFFVRDGGGGGNAAACEDYRAALLAEYGPLRDAQAEIVSLLQPVDEGQSLSDRQLQDLQAAVEEAQARYDAINEMRGPPAALAADYQVLRPTANEFVALAGRTATALAEGGELPTSTPGAQLQNLFDLEPAPEELAACS